jgi:hypothetical protein
LSLRNPSIIAGIYPQFAQKPKQKK